MIRSGAKVWAKTEGNWGNGTPVVSVGRCENMEDDKGGKCDGQRSRATEKKRTCSRGIPKAFHIRKSLAYLNWVEIEPLALKSYCDCGISLGLVALKVKHRWVSRARANEELPFYHCHRKLYSDLPKGRGTRNLESRILTVLPLALIRNVEVNTGASRIAKSHKRTRANVSIELVRDLGSVQGL